MMNSSIFLLRKSARAALSSCTTQWRLRQLPIIGRQSVRNLSSSSSTTTTYRYGDSDNEDDDDKKIALVLGSSGCLGKAVTHHLTTKLNMQVIGVDVIELSKEDSGSDDKTSAAAAAAVPDAFVKMPAFETHPGVADITAALINGLSETLVNGEEIDAIICASGGWQGDPPFPKPEDVDDDEAFLKSSIDYGQTIDKMMEMNLYPVLAAGYAAHKYMAEEALFVVIGATAALTPTPGMLGYGLSKVGAHHFIHTLGETTGKAVTTKTRRQKARRLRKNASSAYLDTLSVVGILPTTIDTPSNREAMPDADFSQWTQPGHIAKEIGTWIRTPPLRPHSGSLVKVHPDNNGGAAFNLVR